MNDDEKIKIVKSDELQFKQTKREAVFAAKAIGTEDSASQNIAVVDLEANARIEDHEIARAESIYIIRGAVDVEFNGTTELLLPGDLVYFPRGTSHALKPRRAPCRLLLVFTG